MDPNLFHLDWERTLEALVGIIVLSFLVERACALLFESRWWIRLFEDARLGETSVSQKTNNTSKSEKKDIMPGRLYPLKEIISFIVALLICYFWDFDAVSIIMLSDQIHLFGIVITALVVAGGSKASIALFHQVLKVRSNAENEQQAIKNQNKK